MATKKQKREAGLAKRAAFEAEQQAHSQHFLQLAQEERKKAREKAEQQRKDRAIAKSKQLAAKHKREKAGIQEHKPMKQGRSILAKIAQVDKQAAS